MSETSPLNGIGKQAALPERASTKYLGLGGSLPITLGKERVPRFVDEIHPSGVDTQEDGTRALEEELGTLDTGIGPQLQGTLVELQGDGIGIQRHRTVAGVPQREPGALGKLTRLQTRRALELERRQVVVGEQLCVVLTAG